MFIKDRFFCNSNFGVIIMAKKSKDQIEQDEKKLLSELVKYSNKNIEKISKHCGFSRQKNMQIH